VFGVRSEQEAARSLSLLGLDPEDEHLCRQLLEFSAARCLLRDHQGRIEAVQVDMASRRLLSALSTTPRREPKAPHAMSRIDGRRRVMASAGRQG
jgi:hypothetical protein